MDAAPGGVGERLPATALSRNPTQSLFDLASARALNRTLHSAFEESAIFRIDHYLAKEAVQNLLYFRFANSFLEPIWNRNYVDNVQIIMAESLPSSRQPGATTKPSTTSRSRSFRSIRPLTPERVVRGQFRGYRDEDGVAPGSTVETFAGQAYRSISERARPCR